MLGLKLTSRSRLKTNKLKSFNLFLLFSLVLTSNIALAKHNEINKNNQNIICKVVGVSDGDTFTCLTKDKTQLKIRLSSIDAPEKAQPFGSKSRQKLSELIFSKEVIVSIENKDKYDRYIAEVFDLNNQSYSVNYQMVATGFAWNYERFSKDIAYQKAQDEAQLNKLGLWNDNPKNIVKPEDFRRSSK